MRGSLRHDGPRSYSVPGTPWFPCLWLAGLLLSALIPRSLVADLPRIWHRRQAVGSPGCPPERCPTPGYDDGAWYWMRSPEQERRVIMGLYNRYCTRCHGVDGRGVWDIPDVPNFADPVWQACRSDAQLTRATIEGRGAVMPQFRGTLTLEEGWAMARYLRSFVPGTETTRPATASISTRAQPLEPTGNGPSPAPPPPDADRRSPFARP